MTALLYIIEQKELTVKWAKGASASWKSDSEYVYDNKSPVPAASAKRLVYARLSPVIHGIAAHGCSVAVSFYLHFAAERVDRSVLNIELKEIRIP